MSIGNGPFYGRKPSRRQFNSLMGTQESYHQIIRGDNVMSTTDDGDEGNHNIGMRTMDTIFHAANMAGSGHPPLARGVSTTSTVNHQIYSNTVIYNTETHGGGSVGESSNDYNKGIGRLNQYIDNRPQSMFPYYKPFFGMMDNWVARQSTSPGFYGANSQGFRDVNSAGAQWRYRQIIAMTYTAGGYKDGSPWRSVHRTKHQNDQTTNLGTLMDHPGSYCAGACNDTTFFMMSTPTDNAHSTNSTRTSAIHMWTETGKSHNSVFNMYNSRQDLSTSQKEQEYAFQTGAGPANWDIFNMMTETRVSQTGTGLNDTSSAFQDKDYGYNWDDNEGRKINFYTWTASSSTHWAAHGQQKGIPSKQRIGYCGNEGSYNGGYNFRRWNLTNDTNIGNIGKIQQNMGEENYGMGQDWQYMIGNYDGAQNNESHKLFYTTDTGPANTSNPSAHAGQSSGHCAWRS